ncbi:unnamed protein product [Owenia fusiformis]|uniref:Uncharacterized protein n=1 Tax=Owenia fusiformis TaxID=6347 RepID=A0A8J1XLG6_OWEFU|nr:unnamed protein product [Owenia fusiformis]
MLKMKITKHIGILNGMNEKEEQTGIIDTVPQEYLHDQPKDEIGDSDPSKINGSSTLSTYIDPFEEARIDLEDHLKSNNDHSPQFIEHICFDDDDDLTDDKTPDIVSDNIDDIFQSWLKQVKELDIEKLMPLENDEEIRPQQLIVSPCAPLQGYNPWLFSPFTPGSQWSIKNCVHGGIHGRPAREQMLKYDILDEAYDTMPMVITMMIMILVVKMVASIKQTKLVAEMKFLAQNLT